MNALPARAEPGESRRRAPLAYSQLTHWHLFRLAERPAHRYLASATRVRGVACIEALRRSLAEVVHRHEALRTRIVICDGDPVQEIYEAEQSHLTVVDLTAYPSADRSGAAERHIEQLMLKPIDATRDPLFEVQVIKLQEEEFILAIVMQHLISDMFSLSVFSRELISIYRQVLQGRVPSLPPVLTQISDYALSQKNGEETWRCQHEAYWNERLARYPHLKFPEDAEARVAPRADWGSVSARIGTEVTARLRNAARLRHTTLVLGMLTAYVALTLRWCEAREGAFRCVTDGRSEPELENTIGFVASVLYPGVALHSADTFADLLDRVTEAYCEAYEHQDFFYLSARVPQPELIRGPSFNWIPLGGGSAAASQGSGADRDVTPAAIPLTDDVLSRLDFHQEPGLLLYETQGGIVANLHFPLSRFTTKTMERFARNFLVFAETALTDPEVLVRDMPLH